MPHSNDPTSIYWEGKSGHAACGGVSIRLRSDFVIGTNIIGIKYSPSPLREFLIREFGHEWREMTSEERDTAADYCDRLQSGARAVTYIAPPDEPTRKARGGK